MESIVVLVLVWALLAGVLSAYILWCLRYQPDRRHVWREALRRAGIVPLMFLASVVSYWLINRINTPGAEEDFLLGFITAWLIPPGITLVKGLIAAPGAASVDT